MILPFVKILMLSILWKMIQSRAEQRWGILSAFPKPIPVRHNAAVFPRFFISQKMLGLPMLPLDMHVAPLGENRSFMEEGSLCFTLEINPGSCIALRKQGLAWFQQDQDFTLVSQERRNWQFGPGNQSSPFQFSNYSYTQKALWFNGTFVSFPNVSESESPPVQPRLAPHCWGSLKEGELWPWTDCQSHMVAWADSAHRFTFSPDMRGPAPHRFSFTMGFFMQADVMIPYDKWLLCGVYGSCSDISPFVLLGGGR